VADPEAGSPTRWTAFFAVLAAFLAVFAGLGWWIASQSYPPSKPHTPCYGCPEAGIGIVFAQLGQVRAAGAGYVCEFLLSPEPPPFVNASNVSLKVYNLSTNTSIGLLNVTLSDPNGTAEAFYHVSGSLWVTSGEYEIVTTVVLTLSTPSNLTGDRAAFWDSAARNGADMPIT
jgi:hypothetical protein